MIEIQKDKAQSTVYEMSFKLRKKGTESNLRNYQVFGLHYPIPTYLQFSPNPYNLLNRFGTTSTLLECQIDELKMKGER